LEGLGQIVSTGKMLSKEEISRYSRHIILSGIGMVGQEKLKQAKVLVIGAGGLGCPVLQYLVSAGAGVIGIADGDVVDETNLQRQILYSSEEVGKPKVEIAKQKLSLLNPFCKLRTFNCRLSSANALEIIKEYDFVIDGSDNFPTRYLMNDACVMLSKPFVSGSIFKFEGQVSVFNYKSGPTYRCLFPEPPQNSPNCAEVGVLGVLPGMIGTMMANEALKIILGIGNILSGKLFVLDALNMQTQIISFEKNTGNEKIKLLTDYELFCSTDKENSISKKISSAELKQMINDKADFQLIDVREKPEYLISNIKGENIPLALIEKNIDRISRSRKVVIHCKSGARSRKAIDLLEKKYGFTNLYNLSGGIDAWK